MKLLKVFAMSQQRRLTPQEIRILQEALSSDCKNSNIRLREGEYQYTLAKTIASFQLDAYFPNVKDIIKRAFGETKANDIQFIRKIQTILKKMEKSNIVKILPKKKPWDLQRYALTSFKFEDVDKNIVIIATNNQLRRSLESLNSIMNTHKLYPTQLANLKTLVLAVMLILSYSTSVWTLLQPVINPLLFISSFAISIVCAVLLGKMLSYR